MVSGGGLGCLTSRRSRPPYPWWSLGSVSPARGSLHEGALPVLGGGWAPGRYLAEDQSRVSTSHTYGLTKHV